MALYSYIKPKSSRFKKFSAAASAVCICTGLSLLIWVLYPILSFEIYYAPRFSGLIKPIPETIGQSLEYELANILGTTTVDYTKASVWFPKAANIRRPSLESSYVLSIPKLQIDNAKVAIGGEDLAKSLIHFTGPLPGNNGNPVIFGHSTIPWIYDPKDYKTIFTKLPDLKNGDLILVKSDNITYQYKVIDMKVVSPNDLAVLEQDYDDSYVTLVTCVPPGTYLKRLIVKGILVNI